RVLIVEDETKLAALLRDYLVQEGYEVTVLHRGDEVEPWVRGHEVDLVLLDLMLPGRTGWTCARRCGRRATWRSSWSPRGSTRSTGSSASSSAPTTTSASPSVRARSSPA